jgi:hypothetical protein
MIRKLMAAATLTAVLLMSGCATSRSEIKLQSPAIAAPATTVTPGQRAVVIGKITDERVFAEAPNNPSVPTLGFGGADKATDDVKARAVGRKRNSWGKALGDVLLQPGQTVESVIRENLNAAFQQAGYRVKDEGDTGPSPLVVDVHIKQFWSWFTPGAFVVTLSNNIATDLVINGDGKPVVVSTHVEDTHAMATESDWTQIVDKGLSAYRAEVSHRMQNSGGADTAVTTAEAPPMPSSAKSALMPVPNAARATVSGRSSGTDTATVPGTIVAAPSQASHESAVASAESTPTPVPASETKPEVLAVATAPASAAEPLPQDSAANAAIAPLAQSIANQLGCGAVQANGAATFIAPCSTYDVLIDCGSGQCRPMHTVNVKHDE